jgi:hypothetical protein
MIFQIQVDLDWVDTSNSFTGFRSLENPLVIRDYEPGVSTTLLSPKAKLFKYFAIWLKPKKKGRNPESSKMGAKPSRP